MRTNRYAIALITVLALWPATVTTAATKTWTGGTGSWSTLGNWNGSTLPLAGDTVNITPSDGVARTVTYDVSAPSLDVLTIDLTGAGTNRTTFSMAANNLNLSNAIAGFIVGNNGRATFNQSGGAVAATGPTQDSAIGWNPNSSGIYNLSGTGSLSVGRDLYVGILGQGAFNQTGGTTTIASRLNVNNQSTFMLAGGNFTATGGVNIDTSTAIIEGAATTLTAGGTSTWSNGGNADVTVRDGATLNLGNLALAPASGSGFVRIQSAASLTTSVTAANVDLGSGGFGEIRIGNGQGLSRLTQTGASTLTVGSTVLNPGGQFHVDSGGVYVGGTGNVNVRSTGFIDVNGGTFTTAGDVLVSTNASATGVFGGIQLQGSSGQLTQTGAKSVTVGAISGSSTGTILVLAGAAFTAASGGVTINPTGTIYISGGSFASGGGITNSGSFDFAAGSLSFVGDLTVGSGGLLGTDLTLNSDRSLTLSGTTTVDASRTFTLNGGTLNTGGLVNNGTFAFNSGSLGISGPSGLTIGSGGLLGTDLTLNSDRSLTLSGNTTIAPGHALVLSGGTLNTAAVVVNGSFAFNSGVLGITGPGGLVVGTGGILGSNVSLGAGRTLNVTQTSTINPGSYLTVDTGGVFSAGVVNNQGEFIVNGSTTTANATTFTNSGLVHGTGRVSAAVTNAASGDVRVSAGERLRFAGASFLNQGLVEAIGSATSPAEIEFFSPVTNASSTGLISGRNNVLRFNGGLTNQGSVAVSIGTSDVFGDISNAATGAIVVSGGAGVTFYDDIVQNGTFRVSKVGSTTSVAVVLGAFSGAGGSTGGGDIFFEGDLRPGNSPAIVNFENNVNFGSAVGLTIELGGTAPGTQYDQVHVSEQLSLGGTLDVDLINGFTPALGNQFTVLTFGSRLGDFASYTGLNVGGHLALRHSFTPTSLVLTARPAVDGDINLDGTVDIFDVNAVSAAWSTTGPQGDANGDGTVDIFDVNLISSNWGATGGATAVPEPSSALLALVGAFSLLRICFCRLQRS